MRERAREEHAINTRLGKIVQPHLKSVKRIYGAERQSSEHEKPSHNIVNMRAWRQRLYSSFTTKAKRVL